MTSFPNNVNHWSFLYSTYMCAFPTAIDIYKDPVSGTRYIYACADFTTGIGLGLI